MLSALRARADRAGIFCDFDGSLSAIVPRPEEAQPVDGAREVLAALVPRYAVVAVVTGRTAQEVAERLSVEGIRYEGLYGLEGTEGSTPVVDLDRVRAAAASVPEAWVEAKGPSVAIHYRQAPDPVTSRGLLLEALRPVVTDSGLDLLEGKMVLELVPPGRAMKGGAVERIVTAEGLDAVLFAGDDVADLDAFAALDRLAGEGALTIKVAVRGEETPDALIASADRVVDGPAGLIELLREL